MFYIRFSISFHVTWSANLLLNYELKKSNLGLFLVILSELKSNQLINYVNIDSFVVFFYNSRLPLLS